MEKDPALERAIQEAGGPSAVAEFISEKYGPITAQAICEWKKCPWRRAAQLAAAAQAKGGKTTARELCPQLFEIQTA